MYLPVAVPVRAAGIPAVVVVVPVAVVPVAVPVAALTVGGAFLGKLALGEVAYAVVLAVVIALPVAAVVAPITLNDENEFENIILFLVSKIFRLFFVKSFYFGKKHLTGRITHVTINSAIQVITRCRRGIYDVTVGIFNDI